MHRGYDNFRSALQLDLSFLGDEEIQAKLGEIVWNDWSGRRRYSRRFRRRLRNLGFSWRRPLPAWWLWLIRLLHCVDRPLAKSFLASSSPRSRRRIVFVVAYSDSLPLVDAVASGLRALGDVELVGLYLVNRPPSDVFDKTFFCEGSLGRLLYVLGGLDCDLIYMQPHADQSFLAVLAKAIRRDVPLVVEVYDWMLFFLEDEELAVRDKVFDRDRIDVMKFSERFIIENAEGLVHKDEGPPLDELLASARAQPLRFLPYRSRRLMCFEEKDDGRNLVLAGTVEVESKSALFDDVRYLPVFRELTHQGFPVTSYTRRVGGVIEDSELREYQEESARNPLYAFRSYLPPQKLIPEIAAEQHFGLVLVTSEETRAGSRHLQVSMSSKLLLYLSAGIPVLVSDRLESMARFVRAHGVGIVVSRSDLGHLADILDSYSYRSLCDAVKKAQAALSLEAHIQDMSSYLRAVQERHAAEKGSTGGRIANSSGSARA